MKVGRCLAVVLLLAWPRLLGASEQEPPSLRRSIERFEGARDRARAEIVAEYDTKLAGTPDDAQVAVERCRFLIASAASDDEFGSEEDAPSADCVAELDARFPHSGAAVAFRITQLWGSEAVEYGAARLRDEKINFSPAERSAVLATIANRQRAAGLLEEANEAAIAAESFDPKFDPSVFIAEYQRSIDQPELAVQALERRLSEDQDRERLLDKARILLDLNAGKLARRAIDAAKRLDDTIPLDPMFEGQVLEAAGDSLAARAAYQRSKDSWNAERVLTRLFELDLERGDGAKANASYQALRDLGWSVDPIGRQRLSLSLAHPKSPFRARDLSGILDFSGCLPGSPWPPARCSCRCTTLD
jgi:hypothetical protein